MPVMHFNCSDFLYISEEPLHNEVFKVLPINPKAITRTLVASLLTLATSNQPWKKKSNFTNLCII